MSRCCPAPERTPPNPTKYAVREIVINSHAGGTKPTNAYQTRFLREIEIYLTLRPHPSICGFGSYSVSNPLRIMVESLPNGSFGDLLESSTTAASRAKATFGFGCAMMHLLGHDAIHRYLTQRDVAFDSN
jgi:hypothetical protein